MNFNIDKASTINRLQTDYGYIEILNIVHSKINDLLWGQTKISSFFIMANSEIYFIHDLRLIEITKELHLINSNFDYIQFYGVSNVNLEAKVYGNKIKVLEFNKFINKSEINLKRQYFY